MHTSRFAQLGFGLAILALAAFLGPPLLIQLGALTSKVGFPIHMLGGLFAVFGLLFGLLGIYATRSTTGRAGRGQALFGALSSGAILAVVGASAGPAAGLPAINDITTDPGDPPAFVAAQDALGIDMAYPGDAFASQQRAAYPDLAALRLEKSPTAAFAIVLQAMRDLGWTIVREDPAAGVLEANETSRVFQFVDDVVVRIRPDGSGAVIDVRSRSREGRGDLGANAARIRRLLDAVR
ncbi:MAG: DUF1499 domain-containing protein [Myxococcota bacterium]